MKSKLMIAAMAIALMGCSSNSKTNTESAETTEPESAEMSALLQDNKWRLCDFAGESEMCEMDSTSNFLLGFNPSAGTFDMQTDCNSIGGEYKLTGDSIKFDNMASTQMACPEEKVENAMKQILSQADTYAILPDSTLLLRADMRTMARFAIAK